MHAELFSDSKCTASKQDFKNTKTLVWGKCYYDSDGKKGYALKGAETLKMAVTGVALALMASLFWLISIFIKN